MKRRCSYAPLQDGQQEAPVAFCCRCGGEIYRYDDVCDVGGGLVHEECMSQEEKDVFPVGKAYRYRGG